MLSDPSEIQSKMNPCCRRSGEGFPEEVGVETDREHEGVLRMLRCSVSNLMLVTRTYSFVNFY